MPILDGVKHACAQCIRGHRTSTCAHNDRPLIPIRPKGRPPTQCVHCREARKAGTGAHSRCVCGEYIQGQTPSPPLQEVRGIKRISPGSSQGKDLSVKAEVFDCQCGCGDTCQCRNKMLRLPNLMNPCGCIDGQSPCTCQSTPAGSVNVLYFGRPSSSSSPSSTGQNNECCCSSTSLPMPLPTQMSRAITDVEPTSSSCCSGGCDCGPKSGSKEAGKGESCCPIPSAMTATSSGGGCCGSASKEKTSSGCCSSSKTSSITAVKSDGGCCSSKASAETPSVPASGGCCSSKAPTKASLAPSKCCSTSKPSASAPSTTSLPSVPETASTFFPPPDSLRVSPEHVLETPPSLPPPLQLPSPVNQEPLLPPNHLSFQVAKHQCGDRCSCSTWASLGLGKAQCGEEGGACGCGSSSRDGQAGSGGAGCCGDAGGCGAGAEEDPFEDDILGV